MQNRHSIIPTRVFLRQSPSFCMLKANLADLKFFFGTLVAEVKLQVVGRVRAASRLNFSQLNKFWTDWLSY